MEKLLSQTEIDALFRAARGATDGQDPAAGSIVELWDLRQAGLMGKEQLHSISQLHESFTRNLSSAMGGYLRDKFEVVLVAVEQLVYRDFLARFADLTYYSTFRLTPGEARGILHLDLSLVFPIVDLLLGGPGVVPQITREVTDIEESVLEGVGQVIGHELEVVSDPLGMRVEFEGRQPTSQMLRIMPPEEKTLSLTFDVGMAASKGMLNIAFPSVVSSALLRKLRAEMVYERARGPAVSHDSIGKQLLKSPATLELATPEIPVRLSDLLALGPDTVLPLSLAAEQPALLRLRHRPWCAARPVSSRNRRAAQLLQFCKREEEQ